MGRKRAGQHELRFLRRALMRSRNAGCKDLFVDRRSSMRRKVRRFADDGWAIWVDGEDTSAFYLDEWVNPGGKSYVDVAVEVRRLVDAQGLYVYIPFEVEKSEVEDLAEHLGDPRFFRAIFSSTGMVDLWKNECTSALAYHGHVVELVHLSKTNFTVKPISSGTLLSLPLDELEDCIEGDEIYLFFRIPHKSLNDALLPQGNGKGFVSRLHRLLVSPVISERYGYSVRINETRLLPAEISHIGALIRQKLDRAVVAIHLKDDYRISTGNCHRIHRLEEGLYEGHSPEKFDLEDVVVYHWQQTRETNLRGHFSFYFDIQRERISISSVLAYVFAIFFIGIATEAVYDIVSPFLTMIFL